MLKDLSFAIKMAQGPILSAKAFICECVSEAVHNWGPNFKFPSDKVNHVQAWTCSLQCHGQPPSASDYSSVIDVKVMRLDTANGHLAEIRLAKASASQQWDLPENTSRIKPVWLAQNQTNSYMIADLTPYSHLVCEMLTRDCHVPIKTRVQKKHKKSKKVREWREENKKRKTSEVGSLTIHMVRRTVLSLWYKLARPVMPVNQKNDTQRSGWLVTLHHWA